jgi:hypothetical protein
LVSQNQHSTHRLLAANLFILKTFDREKSMTNFVLIPTIDSTGKTQYLRAAQANEGSLSLSSTAADVSGDPIVVALDGTDATGVSPLAGRLFAFELSRMGDLIGTQWTPRNS